jgi:hypothetical protein
LKYIDYSTDSLKIISFKMANIKHPAGFVLSYVVLGLTPHLRKEGELILKRRALPFSVILPLIVTFKPS